MIYLFLFIFCSLVINVEINTKDINGHGCSPSDM